MGCHVTLHSMPGGDVKPQVELVLVTWFCLHHVTLHSIAAGEVTFTKRLFNLVLATRYCLNHVVLFTSCDRE